MTSRSPALQSDKQNLPIKTEPVDDNLLSNFQGNEVINLISDDEDDSGKAPARLRTKSPFQEGFAPVDLGPSLLKRPKIIQTSTDAPTMEQMMEKLRAKKRTMARKMREPQQPHSQSNESTLFLSESDSTFPSPADPADQFPALQLTIKEKRSAGIVAIEDDMAFAHAEANEEIRHLQGHSKEYEKPSCMTDNEGSTIATQADFREASADPETEAQRQTGQKRKAPAAPTTQPKKRGRPSKKKILEEPEETEHVLDRHRNAQDAAAKGKTGAKTGTKGKGRAQQAPKSKDATTTVKKQRSKGGPQAPTMLNTASLNNTNVFNDAAQTENFAAPPTFDKSTNRPEAIQQLLESVPQENLTVATKEMEHLDKQLKHFGANGHNIKPGEGGNWDLKGMKVSLKPYQVLGAAFMRQREASIRKPKGGILADEMGLGKTITALATIVNGKSFHTSKCHTTLIVASAALVSQWATEIEEKVFSHKENKKYGIGRVLQYHAGAKIKGSEVLETLKDCDIILTTYTQVCQSYPSAAIPAECVTAEQKQRWWEVYYEKNRGPLHRIEWHRVVLDEAHVIKNHTSLTSRACAALKAPYRWSVSGTIVLNSPKEFYAQFKFLQVRCLSS